PTCALPIFLHGVNLRRSLGWSGLDLSLSGLARLLRRRLLHLGALDLGAAGCLGPGGGEGEAQQKERHSHQGVLGIRARRAWASVAAGVPGKEFTSRARSARASAA